ncbi:MAG: thiamine pyrophosphokinase [Elusimicrobiota bacterium]|jgi:thiamine pyrophosphokinase
MKSPRVLILLNGELGDPAAARRAAKGALVLCADGGLRHALRLRLRPDFVVGDMDSLPRRVPPLPGTTFLCDFDLDRSDFQKALDLARRLGARSASIAGNAGGRLDHRLAAFAAAERFITSPRPPRGRGAGGEGSRRPRLEFIDEGRAFPAGPGLHRLDCIKGETVSLLPSTPAALVTTRALAFALRRTRLPRGTRGLSNTALTRRVSVRVHRGLLWIVRPDKSI